jgi:hypothetical protein
VSISTLHAASPLVHQSRCDAQILPKWWRRSKTAGYLVVSARIYGGLGVALLIGLFLLWLWQPERQVKRHTGNLLHAIEQKDWASVADFIGNDYQDQWGDDRALVLERIREVFRYLRGVRINIVDPNIEVDKHHGVCRARITVDGNGGEAMALVKERVNSLNTPFELEWRRMSGKPWDWKLIRVANQSLEISAGFE